MRFLHYPLLTFSLAVLVSGCGQKGEMATQVEATSGDASADEEYSSPPPSGATPANFAADAPALSDASEGMPASEPADHRELASIPKRDLAEPERPRSRKPAADKAVKQAEEARREKKQPQQPQAGTLTAGSLNDHKNLEDFRDFLSQAQQSPGSQQLPAFNLGERVVIEVHDAEGNGVGNAQVTLTQAGQATDENEGVLLDTWTRADGRTFFSSGFDNRSDAETFELTVRPPGGKPIVQQVSLSQTPWTVKVPEVTRELPQQLDLALVIDTTGSMGDELDYLKVEIDQIAHTISRMYPNVQQRYSLIVYRDENEAYVRRVFDFTDSLVDFREHLAAQSAQGGGDHPEAMHIALEAANDLSWRRENTARVMFLVADAPPHSQRIDRSMKAVNDLRQKSVAVYPLAGSGINPEFEFLMRAAAFLTRGQYLFLTDHSGVGNPHAKPQARKYEVEPLKQLMIRMIASELAGKEVLAQEVIATEENDGSEPPSYPQDQDQSAIDPPEHRPQAGAVQSHRSAATQRDVWAVLWESTWVRILAGVVLIAGILIVDHRMRT